MPLSLRQPIPIWMDRNALLIVVARGVRTFGQGTVAVIMAIYLHLLGFSPVQIGLFLSAGLAGAAFFTFLIVLFGDSVGRRRLLTIFSLLLAGAAMGLVITDRFPLLIAIAFLGSFSVAGGAASGPIQPLEQACLAESVPADKRTNLYAIYNILGIGALALGSLAAGLPVLYQNAFGMSELASYRVVFATFAGLSAVAGLSFSLMSPAVETSRPNTRWVNPMRLPSRRLIFTLSGLFGLDHFGGGLIVQSLVSLWFYTKFGIKLESIALIFFGANLTAAGSMWAAAKLGNRFGLINTMVFTHIPASVILIAVPFVPAAWMAASLWMLRGFFSMMDVPTRQSYTMAIVGSDERSAMAGINSLTRSVTGTVSPSVATGLWSIGAAGLPFIVGGTVKIVYDLTLYFMFRNIRPPEEADKIAARDKSKRPTIAG